MTFTKRLRDGVRRGEITCSVRIWTRPHVKVGGRYRMEEGEVEVDSIEPIGLPDITPQLARESGFLGVVDLLCRGRDVSRPAPPAQNRTGVSHAYGFHLGYLASNRSRGYGCKT